MKGVDAWALSPFFCAVQKTELAGDESASSLSVLHFSGSGLTNDTDFVGNHFSKR